MALRRLGKELLGIFSLRQGEVKRALLSALYLFLIIASYIALKPVRSAFFLDEFRALKLPYVQMTYAIGSGFFVAGYTRLARRFSVTRLTIGTLLLCIVTVLAFWWFAQTQPRLTSPVLYVWVSMYGGIAVAQVWILVGNLFTVREAKRAFGPIGAGGLLGAIVGSACATHVIVSYGAVHVLLFVIALIIAAIAVVLALHRIPAPSSSAIPRKEHIPTRITESLGMISRSGHLRAITGLVFLTALATSVADWQFQAVLSDHYSGDELAAFMSTFFLVVNILAVAVQVFLTSRLIRWAGIGGAVLLLPVGFLASTGALFATVRVWAATLLKGIEQTFKHSLDRASRELLYLPLSPQVKLPVKSAIDMVVDRLGDGSAGIALILLFNFLPGETLAGTVQHVALFNIFIIAAWLYLAYRLQRTYSDELGKSIAAGRVEISTWSEALAGSETLKTVESALASPSEPVVIEALELIARNPQWKIHKPLIRLLREGSPEVQARVLAILLDPQDEGLPEGIARTFGLEDQALLSECLDILLAEDEHDRSERIEHLLARAGGTARGAWIVLLVRRLGPEYTPFAQKLVSSLLEGGAPSSAREVAAAAIGNMPLDSGMAEWLPGLLKDDDLRVAAAAATSAGSIGGTELLSLVIPLLGFTDSRTAARRALQRNGPVSVPLLVAAARDRATRATVRLRIPAVLAGIGNSEAIAALIELLSAEDLAMVAAASYGLQRVGGVDRGAAPAQLVRRRIHEIARELARWEEELAGVRARLVTLDNDAAQALEAGLEERRRRFGNVLLRLLCLVYPPRTIIPSWRGLLSGDPVRHANASEYLESLSPRRFWQPVLAVMRLAEDELIPPASDEALGSGLATIRGGTNRWLSAVATQLAVELGYIPPEEAPPMSGMSVVDKVIALKKVDVFQEIPGEELSRIAALAIKVRYSPDETLFQQDDSAGDLFIVLEGELRLVRDGVELGRVGPGEAIGAWGLFEDDPRQAAAMALGEVETLRIDRWGFDELLNEHPEIARSFIRHLVRRIRRLVGR